MGILKEDIPVEDSLEEGRCQVDGDHDEKKSLSQTHHAYPSTSHLPLIRINITLISCHNKVFRCRVALSLFPSFHKTKPDMFFILFC